LASVASRGLRRSQKNDDEQQTLWALKDVSFVLHRGESLGIVGPNGAGKTTMLKALSRVIQTTSGRIEVNGRLSALIELGAGFHPELTGRENVFLNGTILGLSRQEVRQRFDSIVSFSGLERFIDTPVKRYSSGMYVRLGFAVAAHTDPDVLLVDEVLAVGDAEFREKCLNRMNSLRENGVSVVFISHNVFQVRAVCERGIFLLGGQVQEEGSVVEAIGGYESWMRQRHKSSNNGRDAADFDPERGTDDLEITGIELLGESNQSTNEFGYSEPIEIRVHFIARRSFPSYHFAVQINRLDGMSCAILRSRDLSLNAGDLEGKGYLSIKLPQLQLTSGVYVVEAHLRDNSDIVTLAKSQSAPFEVIGPLLSGQGITGVFVPHITDAVTVIDPESCLVQPSHLSTGRA
jgi:lipopolysaccharide transport system ATP-binding protein